MLKTVRLNASDAHSQTSGKEFSFFLLPFSEMTFESKDGNSDSVLPLPLFAVRRCSQCDRRNITEH